MTDWTTVRLGDITQVQGGYAFKSAEYRSDGHYLVRIANVIDDQVVRTDDTFVEVIANSSLSKFILKERDLLMTLTGNIGRTAFVQKGILPAVLNQRVARLEPQTQLILPEFLRFALQMPTFKEHISSRGRGAAQQNISTKDIEDFIFPLPPLDEQKRIVAKLEEAQAQFERLSNNLDLQVDAIDDFGTAVLNESMTRSPVSEVHSPSSSAAASSTAEPPVSGWSKVPLGEAAYWSGGLTPSTKEPRYWTEGQVPWISSQDIKSANLKITNRCVTTAAIAETSLSKFPAGGVAVVVRSGVLQHTFPVSYINFECVVNQDVKYGVPRGDVDGRYLAAVLTSMGESILRDCRKEGATVQSVTVAKLMKVQIPLPPLDEQKRIVAKLDEATSQVDYLLEINKKNQDNANSFLGANLDNALTKHYDSSTTVLLGDVCSIASRLVDPRHDPYAEMAHIGAGNITEGSAEITNVRTAREEGLKSGKYTFDRGDVLYSKIRPYLRKVWKPDFEGLCSADMYPLTADRMTLDRDYLYWLLLSRMFTEYAISGSARTGMPKVNQEWLFSFRFSLPQIDSQRETCNILNSIQRETKKMRQIFDQKDLLIRKEKDALLASAFAGDI